MRLAEDQNQAVGSGRARDPLHNRNELHKAAADFRQEAVNLKRIVRIVALDDGKCVVSHIKQLRDV